jgi:hypothetical protein
MLAVLRTIEELKVDLFVTTSALAVVVPVALLKTRDALPAATPALL